MNSHATLCEVNLFQPEHNSNGNLTDRWDGLSQIHHLYASQANWAFDDDQASTVDVDATSRVQFLFESQNSLRAALRDALDGEDGMTKTIYDEDGTEMSTYRSDGGNGDEGEGSKPKLENISEEEERAKNKNNENENESESEEETSSEEESSGDENDEEV